MSNEIAKQDDEQPSNPPANVPPVPPEVLRLEKSDPKTFRAVEQYMLQVAVHSGPLPSAQQLAEYERASPGVAKEIIEMAKSEQATRHYCVRTEVGAIQRGQLCAVGSFGIAMAATCYLAFVGAAVAAATVGSTAITVFGGAFILARHYGAKQEGDEKPKQKPSQPKKPQRAKR